MDDLKAWGWLVAIVLNGVIALALYAMRSTYASRADHEKLATRMALAEQKIEQVPTHADLADLSGRLAAIEGQLAPIAASVRRIEDFLLKRT